MTLLLISLLVFIVSAMIGLFLSAESQESHEEAWREYLRRRAEIDRNVHKLKYRELKGRRD